MPKTIKIPLEMKNGEKATDMKSLVANFDVESVVGHFLDGKLKKWLDDRYYEEEAEKVSQLEKDDPALAAKLCEIFGVPYEAGAEIDTEELAERKERLSHLKQLTDDEEILRNIDSVAFDQEELAELYDKGVQKIYLCEGDFHIPKSKQGLEYVLVADATVEGLAKKEEPKVVDSVRSSSENDNQFDKLQSLIELLREDISGNWELYGIYAPRVEYSSGLSYTGEDIHSKSEAKSRAEGVVLKLYNKVDPFLFDMASQAAEALFSRYEFLPNLSSLLHQLAGSTQAQNSSVIEHAIEMIDRGMQDKFLSYAEGSWSMGGGRLKTESYYYGKIEYSEHEDIFATGFFKKKNWWYNASDAQSCMRDDVEKIQENYRQCTVKYFKQSFLTPLVDLLSQIKN